MRRHLLDQIGGEQEKFGLGHLDLHPLSMFDKKGAAKLDEHIGDRPRLVVLDEAHHDAATSMTDVYQAVKPDMTLGLSATPFRVDRAKLCFEKQIRDAGIHRLISDGWLSKFNSYTLEDWKPENVANHYLAEPEKWGQSVFYFLNTERAKECYTRLWDAGVKVDMILGGDKELKRKLRDFRAGHTTCLVNCMVLTEGFDCPELETAWVRPSSRGPTMQMAGRAYRICETVPRKKIVQSRDTRYPITRCATPEEQYVWMQNQWISVTTNKETHNIAIAAIKRTINNWKPLPDYIRSRQGKGKRVFEDRDAE
jgi:superfamily II DNA or RNA helicase